MNRALQKLVWRRAQSCCEYCRLPDREHPLPCHMDHIIARQHGGRTEADNLALACYDCNQYKGPNIAGIDPATSLLTALFHPRRDRWEEHFVWRGPVLVGKTSVGRTTIEVLQINAPIRVNVRRALIDIGVFPPEL